MILCNASMEVLPPRIPVMPYPQVATVAERHKNRGGVITAGLRVAVNVMDVQVFPVLVWSFAADKTDVSKKEPYPLLKLFVEPETIRFKTSPALPVGCTGAALSLD